jgi:S-adenosylmethionine:tRNA ribosyltransferase-isomerase
MTPYNFPILTNDFNYDLPGELIAQLPLEPRDSSKLMLLDRTTGSIQHSIFSELPNILKDTDLLILNNSKVIPARLKGTKNNSNGKVELLLLKKLPDDSWHCLAKPGKRVRAGDTIILSGESNIMTTAKVLSTNDDGSKIIRLENETDAMKIGELPLPPYIRTHDSNTNRYQTIYSSDLGSVAAPTAGLHFTESLLGKIQNKGITIAYTTLHIGLDTFKPIQESDARNHLIHKEYFHINQQNIAKINNAIKNNSRIICIGTTSVRVLEYLGTQAMSKNQTHLEAQTGENDIFILPGYQFKVVTGMVTNFHLPKSTLLMMISAFTSKSIIMSAYQEAINHNYRFFSYGDAMLIT